MILPRLATLSPAPSLELAPWQNLRHGDGIQRLPATLPA